MTKGSKVSGQSASKTVATTGYVSSVPVKSTVSFKGSGRGERSYQTTSRVSYGDKQSGCYGRATTKEKASAGEFHWKNGTTGTRSEYTQSSTVRVGDKKGYTEVHNEQRVRNVSYDKSGSNSQITYNNDDNRGYGSDSDDGCDYESDSDEGGDYDSENEEGCDYDSENDEGGDYDSDSGDGGDYDNDSDNGDGGDYDNDSDNDDGGSDGYDSDY